MLGVIIKTMQFELVCYVLLGGFQEHTECITC